MEIFNDELKEDELDLVLGGTGDRVAQLEWQIEKYQEQLSNPKNGASEREFIYKQIEKLQAELEQCDYQRTGRSR